MYYSTHLKLVAKIVKRKNKWCVVSETSGKSLGCYDTKEKAVKRLRQVEFFKHKHKGQLIDEAALCHWLTLSGRAGDIEDMMHRLSNDKVFEESLAQYGKTFKQFLDDVTVVVEGEGGGGEYIHDNGLIILHNNVDEEMYRTLLHEAIHWLQYSTGNVVEDPTSDQWIDQPKEMEALQVVIKQMKEDGKDDPTIVEWLLDKYQHKNMTDEKAVELLMSTYAKLNDNDENKIMQIAQRVKNKKYTHCQFGSCLPASDDLYKELTMAKYKPKIVQGYFGVDKVYSYDYEDKIMKDEPQYHVDHTWIEIDGKILDITRDQFNNWMNEKFDGVFFGNNDEYKYGKRYVKQATFNNDSHIHDYNIKKPFTKQCYQQTINRMQKMHDNYVNEFKTWHPQVQSRYSTQEKLKQEIDNLKHMQQAAPGEITQANVEDAASTKSLIKQVKSMLKQVYIVKQAEQPMSFPHLNKFIAGAIKTPSDDELIDVYAELQRLHFNLNEAESTLREISTWYHKFLADYPEADIEQMSGDKPFAKEIIEIFAKYLIATQEYLGENRVTVNNFLIWMKEHGQNVQEHYEDLEVIFESVLNTASQMLEAPVRIVGHNIKQIHIASTYSDKEQPHHFDTEDSNPSRERGPNIYHDYPENKSDIWPAGGSSTSIDRLSPSDSHVLHEPTPAHYMSSPAQDPHEPFVVWDTVKRLHGLQIDEDEHTLRIEWEHGEQETIEKDSPRWRELVMKPINEAALVTAAPKKSAFDGYERVEEKMIDAVPEGTIMEIYMYGKPTLVKVKGVRPIKDDHGTSDKLVLTNMEVGADLPVPLNEAKTLKGWVLAPEGTGEKQKEEEKKDEELVVSDIELFEYRPGEERFIGRFEYGGESYRFSTPEGPASYKDITLDPTFESKVLKGQKPTTTLKKIRESLATWMRSRTTKELDKLRKEVEKEKSKDLTTKPTDKELRDLFKHFDEYFVRQQGGLEQADVPREEFMKVAESVGIARSYFEKKKSESLPTGEFWTLSPERISILRLSKTSSLESRAKYFIQKRDPGYGEPIKYDIRIETPTTFLCFTAHELYPQGHGHVVQNLKQQFNADHVVAKGQCQWLNYNDKSAMFLIIDNHEFNGHYTLNKMGKSPVYQIIRRSANHS